MGNDERDNQSIVGTTARIVEAGYHISPSMGNLL
jgi:hypothetical protein